MPNPSVIPEHRRANADQFCTAKPVESKGVDIKGQPVESTLETCVAKTTYDPQSEATRYWVKQATTGDTGAAGHFFNPQSGNHDTVHRRGSMARALGKDLYEFRPVTEEQYGFYLKFLETGNQSYVLHAERL